LNFIKNTKIRQGKQEKVLHHFPRVIHTVSVENQRKMADIEGV